MECLSLEMDPRSNKLRLPPEEELHNNSKAEGKAED